MGNMLPCPAVNSAPTFRLARVVAFDNDGTLYPSGEQIGRAVLTAHREYVAAHGIAMPTPPMEWVQQLIGMDAKDFYGAMLPGQPPEVVHDFEEFCLDLECATVQRFPHLYEGADALLKALHADGRMLVLVTNGPPRYVQNVWDATGLGRYMQAMYPYSPPDFATKGERLARAIVEWGGGPAVMIGDRRSDVEAAREAGVPVIGAGYGYSRDGELAGADAVVGSIRELYNLLLGTQEVRR
jgi:phosphoglycolate phosphatase